MCSIAACGRALRDWSLITGRGGYTTGGGAREVLPLRKRGPQKVLAMLIMKGGHKMFWGSFYAVALGFSHIVGGCEKFPLFETGGAKSFTLS